MNTDIRYTGQTTTERDGDILMMVIQLRAINPNPPAQPDGYATDPYLYRHLAINTLDGTTMHDYIGPYGL